MFMILGDTAPRHVFSGVANTGCCLTSRVRNTTTAYTRTHSADGKHTCMRA